MFLKGESPTLNKQIVVTRQSLEELNSDLEMLYLRYQDFLSYQGLWLFWLIDVETCTCDNVRSNSS